MNFSGLGKLILIAVTVFGALTGVVSLIGLFGSIWTSVMLCLVLAAAIGFWFNSFKFAVALAASGCSGAVTTCWMIQSLGLPLGLVAGIPAGLVVAVVVFSILLYATATNG